MRVVQYNLVCHTLIISYSTDGGAPMISSSRHPQFLDYWDGPWLYANDCSSNLSSFPYNLALTMVLRQFCKEFNDPATHSKVHLL